MSIESKKNAITLSGIVTVEEAENLLELLQKKPNAKLDLPACTHLHTANLQVLMAARPAIAHCPDNPELRVWIENAFEAVP